MHCIFSFTRNLSSRRDGRKTLCTKNSGDKAQLKDTFIPVFVLQISFVDFLVLEQLDRYELIAPGAVAKFPSLAAFHKRILAIPSIAQYRQSPAFQKIKARYFGRMCKIGGGEETY